MRFYLKVVNPVIALTALILCTWAAIFGDDKIHLFGIVAGSFTSYFFAKGLFTSGALFLLGKLLEATINKDKQGKTELRTRSEKALFVTFLCLSIGLLAGLFFWGKKDASTEAVIKYAIQNPAGLQVTEYHHVKETDRVNIAITMQNSANSEWNLVKVTAKLFIGGRYSGEKDLSFRDVKPGQKEQALIEFYNIQNAAIKDSLTCQFQIDANPKNK